MGSVGFQATMIGSHAARADLRFNVFARGSDKDARLPQQPITVFSMLMDGIDAANSGRNK